MKHSDAMRKADELGLPDRRGVWVSRFPSEWAGEKPACCAIGGANVAAGNLSFAQGVGVITTDPDRAMSTDGFDVPNVSRSWLRCPHKRCYASGRDYGPHSQLRDMVAHLYDDHGWGRTQIADWLDSLVAA
jgi:hypothetical protein